MIALAINTHVTQGGERVINIGELLASCPDNLVWEDWEEEEEAAPAPAAGR
jgi:hypothetical protein